MINCDNILQECSDYVLKNMKSLVTTNPALNILEHPTIASIFNEDLLQYNWEPLQNIDISGLNKDLLRDLTLKKAINDLLVINTETSNSIYDNNNDDDVNTDNNNDAADSLFGKLQIAALILDLCFHSRKFRSDITSWKIAYFDLFGLTIDLLHWPIDISKFWVYAESRIEWFKSGNSFEPDQYNGISQLISYKQPLSDKLRHWNDFLKLLEYNSSLNTPLDYIMKYKLEKFISNLLPINEESNFNRSAIVSKKQDSGNPWNTKRLSGRPTTSEENLAQDYKFVFNKFISSPIEFAFKPLDFKLDVEKPLLLLLDALFDTEDEFYKRIKFVRRRQLAIEDKINPNFQSDFNIYNTTIPHYMNESEMFQNERCKLWENIESFHDSSQQILRPTFLDISSKNYSILYKQLTTLDNDYYRKQFMLQVVFVCKIVERLLTVEDIKLFYRNCYAKEDMLKFVNFDNLDESNIRKTKALCHHLCEMRVKTFYVTRDPTFYRIIQSLEQNDKLYLNAKVDGFKCFNNYNLSLIKNENSNINRSTNYQFKKFGFIKLGNKQINNVWKIQSGLNSIPENNINPKDIYDNLKQEYMNENFDPNEKDIIVKEWQALRSLRSQYLFEFNKVNEKVSLKGLFDECRVENDSKGMDKFKELEVKMKESHRTKLEKAREYRKTKETLKRKMMEDSTIENSNKDTSNKTLTNENKKIKLEISTEVQKNMAITSDDHPSENEDKKNENKEETINKDIPVEHVAEQTNSDKKEDDKKDRQSPITKSQEKKESNIAEELTTNKIEKDNK